MNAQTVLRARGLRKTYGDPRVTSPALDGIDLCVDRGESLAIMGASGSGKTTLLHCLAGILTPDSGTIAVTTPSVSVEVSALTDAERSRLRREQFGFVFQQGLLLPELTAVENVALALMLQGVSRAEAEAQAARWLGYLGLAGLENRRLGELSGGQGQRVAIARAQVTAPAIVFADEPTGALDSRTSFDVMRALAESTVARGSSLVVVTHDRSVAEQCSRIVTVQDGRIVNEKRAATGPERGESAVQRSAAAGHPSAGAGQREAFSGVAHDRSPRGENPPPHGHDQNHASRDVRDGAHLEGARR